MSFEIKEVPISEIPQEILDKVRNMKKSGKVVQSLSDGDLDGIAGGFRKKRGFARGMEIECPFCGRNTKKVIKTWEDREEECSMFWCSGCGTCWGVYEDGCIREP